MSSRWSEEAVVELIRESFDGLVAPGARGLIDDGAWLPKLSPSFTRVISCDAFQEGNDFLLSIASAESAGYRAMVQNISDLAAMGAIPVGFVWSLEVPSSWLKSKGKLLSQFCDGAAKACREEKLPFFGGDLSLSKDRFACTVTIFGDVEGMPLSRQGAKPGDAIYVSRPLGLSAFGLERLLKKKSSPEIAIAAHLSPKAEVVLGKKLVGLATSCMDISDGLARDLHRLCKASQVGAELDALEAVFHPELPVKKAREYGLHGGEEYALLFTAPPKQRVNKRCIRIGMITDQSGVVSEKRGQKSTRIKSLGYDHFTSRT